MALRKRNFDEIVIDEQLNKLLLSRKAHMGTLSKRIDEITSFLNNLNNKNTLTGLVNCKKTIKFRRFRGQTSPNSKFL